MHSTRVFRWGLLLLLALLLACTPSASPTAPALQTSSPAPTPSPLPETLPLRQDLMEEAWRALRDEFLYKDRLDPESLTEGAIKGMLDSLQDPFTSYMPADLYKLEKTSFHGSFEGIGAVVTMKEGVLAVIAPIAGSPAERAGVMADDLILEVDGTATRGLSLTEAVLKIRGPKGTRVTLTILRPGQMEPVTVIITREEIREASVQLKEMKDGIARIRITQFSESTPSELTKVLQDLRQPKVRAIILDLRHNPGGLLDAVVSVASQFLKGGIVLYEEDSQGHRQPWEAKGGGLATDLPLAILVDGASASGSEVLAGALQDYGRGPLIGTKTFGKGSINHIRELSDGSALFITYAHWLTPKGRPIQDVGLPPDFVVEVTPADAQAGRDPQLERALEYLTTGK